MLNVTEKRDTVKTSIVLNLSNTKRVCGVG